MLQLNIIHETPEMQSQLVSAHGMLAILEVLESRTSRDVTLKLLQIINAVSDPRHFHRIECLTDTMRHAVARHGGHGVPRELLSYWVRSKCHYMRGIC